MSYRELKETNIPQSWCDALMKNENLLVNGNNCGGIVNAIVDGIVDSLSKKISFCYDVVYRYTFIPERYCKGLLLGPDENSVSIIVKKSSDKDKKQRIPSPYIFEMFVGDGPSPQLTECDIKDLNDDEVLQHTSEHIEDNYFLKFIDNKYIFVMFGYFMDILISYMKDKLESDRHWHSKYLRISNDLIMKSTRTTKCDNNGSVHYEINREFIRRPTHN